MRAQMALIPGYTNTLDSMSPVVQGKILEELVKKGDALVPLLEPFRLRRPGEAARAPTAFGASCKPSPAESGQEAWLTG